MPTYEYRCTQCDHVFDCVQRVGDPAPTCPKCGSPTRKVFSSVGLIFKGKGFHSTDYRKPAPVDGEAKPNAAPHGEATSGTPEKEKSASKDTSPPTKDAPAPKGGASSSASDS